MLEARGLSVRYGDTVALEGVDLDVGEHETVAVLGPSGSGKTTLLRAIAGLEPLAAGRVLHDGTDVTGLPVHRRGLGLMFQDQTLFPHRDVLGNVAFGLRMQGLSRWDAAERAHETLALVGLDGFASRAIRQLSGGEAQRVALARALAPAPRLLMLDEPFGALDRALREHLVEELRELFDRLRLSVLVVTHDHDEAFGLGDRVAVMHTGRIEQVGPPVEVWRHPRTEFVARFLGWNVLRHPVHGSLGVPPDAVGLGTMPSATGRAGTVTARTFRRDHFRVQVVLDGGEQIEALSRGVPPETGDRVGVTFEDDATVTWPGPEAATGSAR